MNIQIPNTLTNIRDIQHKYLNPDIIISLSFRSTNIVQEIQQRNNLNLIIFKAVFHAIYKFSQSNGREILIQLSCNTRESTIQSLSKTLHMCLIIGKETQLILKIRNISTIREGISQSLKTSTSILIVHFIRLHIIQTLINNMKKIICHISSRSRIFATFRNVSSQLLSQFLQLRLISIIKFSKLISILSKSVLIQIIRRHNLLINICTSILAIHRGNFLTRSNKIKVLTKIVNSLQHGMATLKTIQFFCNRILQRDTLQQTHGFNLSHILIQYFHIIILIQNMIIGSITQNIRSGNISRIILNLFIHFFLHLLKLISSRLHSNHIVLLSRNLLQILSTQTTITTILLSLFSQNRKSLLVLRTKSSLILLLFLRKMNTKIFHLKSNSLFFSFTRRFDLTGHVRIELKTKMPIIILTSHGFYPPIGLYNLLIILRKLI